MIRQDNLITVETLLKSNAALFGDHDAVSGDAQHGIVVKSAPAVSFKMTNTHLGLSFAVFYSSVSDLPCHVFLDVINVECS